jgi:hypothetical protein
MVERAGYSGNRVNAFIDRVIEEDNTLKAIMDDSWNRNARNIDERALYNFVMMLRAEANHPRREIMETLVRAILNIVLRLKGLLNPVVDGEFPLIEIAEDR